MALYFLHLRDGTEELLDPEGNEFPDLNSLRKAVLMTVRDLITGDVRDGLIDFRFRIDAEDQDGKIIYTLPFKHALHIIPDSAAEPALA